MRSKKSKYLLPVLMCLLVCGFTHPKDGHLPEAITESTPPEPVQSVITPVTVSTPSTPLYSREEIEVLAQLLWGEARGVESDTEKAACVWCVLNRCDQSGETIIEVATAPYQFTGYRESNPVAPELVALVEDVLMRWGYEKRGADQVGRVLPADYLFFHGDGERNHFRNEYQGGTQWDWSLPTPYES